MTKDKKYTRDELIKICEDAVIHHTKWADRDSYLAQRSIQDIYLGLTAGLEYKVKKNDPFCCSLVVEFIKPINYKKLKNGKHLEISSREEYFEDCDPEYETEMFDGEGIDFYSNFTQTYMPTRERLNNVGHGNDWY